MTWPTQFQLRVNEPFDAAIVTEIERLIGVSLPKAFLSFLESTNGGGYVDDLVAECEVPTPFGKSNIVQIGNVKGILRLLDSDVAPRNMICIAHGHFGITTCLSVAGIDHGHVYALEPIRKLDFSKTPVITTLCVPRSNGVCDERRWTKTISKRLD